MANNNARFQTRSRVGVQRSKVNGDENATSKHIRQASGLVGSGASRASAVLNGIKANVQRPALGEVTTTAVNRKDVAGKATGKDNLKEST
ncbi:hypothetical protein SERLA73DRAFT_136567, partial [Serpula lacrymans var. lacrymans S7.3]